MKNIVLCAILSVLFLSSCATETPQGKTEAEALFNEAKDLVEDGRFILATEKLNIIKSQHPYSYYATHAELMLGDIQFKQGSFVEAAATYTLFRDFHPRHKKIEYVLFRIAESYYFQLPSSFDRDLSAAYESIKYYRYLLREYPKSEYVKDAHKRIKESEKMIWQKAKYIADFYYKTDDFGAAKYRYLDILESFQISELREHSMMRIIQSTVHLREKNDCLKYHSKYQSFFKGKKEKKFKKMRSNCEKIIVEVEDQEEENQS